MGEDSNKNEIEMKYNPQTKLTNFRYKSGNEWVSLNEYSELLRFENAVTDIYECAESILKIANKELNDGDIGLIFTFRGTMPDFYYFKGLLAGLKFINFELCHELDDFEPEKTKDNDQPAAETMVSLEPENTVEPVMTTKVDNIVEQSESPESDNDCNYSHLRALICSCDNLIPNTNEGNNKKRIARFVQKSSLHILDEAIIALIDTSLLNDGASGVLFSISGIYIRESIFDKLSAKYADIDTDSCTISRNKKGNINGLTIPLSGKDYFFADGTWAVKLLDLLQEIKKNNKYALTDEPESILETDDYVRELYCVILANMLLESGLDAQEAIRVADDLGIDTSTPSIDSKQQSAFHNIFANTENVYDNTNIDELLDLLDIGVVYPSFRPIVSSLLIEFIRLALLTRKSPTLSQKELNCIGNIAQKSGISAGDLDKIKKIGQLAYRMLTKSITQDEAQEIFKIAQTLLGINMCFNEIVYGNNIAMRYDNEKYKEHELSEMVKEIYGLSYDASNEKLKKSMPFSVHRDTLVANLERTKNWLDAL